MNADQDQPSAELTGEIIKVFYEVYNELGPGFLESIYEKWNGRLPSRER